MLSETNFADRFFWARMRSRLGANTIARKTGCAQSLISAIENGARKSSKYNDAFATLFKVDKDWLRDGTGRAPEGFDAEDVARIRASAHLLPAERGGEVVPLTRPRPQWAAPLDSAASSNDEVAARKLQKSLFSDFQDYVEMVGPVEARQFLAILENATRLMTAKEPKRDREQGPGED